MARLVCILLPEREAKLMCRCRRDRQRSTVHRTVEFSFSSLSQSMQNPLTASAVRGFWSKWRDANSRHPAPKELLELVSNIFCSVLAPFIPEKLLFRTLVSTISVCSEASYGQQCGQIQRLPGSKVNRGAFFPLRCGDCSFEKGIRQVISVIRIEWL